MAEYQIYKNGDLEAVLEISVFDDPKIIKYTITETLENDDDDIAKRSKILSVVMKINPEILTSYRQLDPESPLLEENVHAELLKALIANGANFRESDEDDRNLVAVAVESDMNGIQFHSLCAYLINERKAYDLFNNNGNPTSDFRDNNDWICPVFFMLHPEIEISLDTLRMIFDIPGFDMNQTCPRIYNSKEGRKVCGLTLLQKALSLGKDLNVHKLMIEKGADYKRKFRRGRTFLTMAVSRVNFKAVDYYMSLGCSVHEKDNNGNTPMLFSYKNLELVDYLKSRGADITVINNDGYSVLHCAAIEAESDLFCKFITYFTENAPELLTKKCKIGADILQTRRYKHPNDHKGIELLEKVMEVTKRNHTIKMMKECMIFKNADLLAVQNVSVFSDPSCIKHTIIGTLNNDCDDIGKRIQILNKIMDSNPEILESYTDFDIESPLLEKNVHADLLITLIENGADLQFAIDYDYNVVAMAALSNMNEFQLHSLCAYLINDHKAYDLFSKIAKKDECRLNVGTWQCPVFEIFTSKYQHIDTLKVIFGIPGFDINQSVSMPIKNEGTFELTLFQIANKVCKGVDVYKLMIENGADYQRKYPHNASHLMYATKCADKKAIKYYLSLGFSVNERNSNGTTLMMHACSDLKMIDVLRFMGGDLSSKDNDCNSVIHHAARSVSPNCFHQFVTYFGEHVPGLLNKKNNKGETPLDVRRQVYPDDQKGIDLLELFVETH